MSSKSISTKDFIQVEDLPLAITLHSRNYKLDTVRPIGSRRYSFCFEQDKGIEELIDLYKEGAVLVEPNYFWFNATWVIQKMHEVQDYEI